MTFTDEFVLIKVVRKSSALKSQEGLSLIVIIIIIAVVVIGVGYSLLSSKSGNSSSNTTSQSSNSNWQTYTAPLAEGNFQVELPSTPQKSTDKQNISGNPQQPVYTNITQLRSLLDNNTGFQVYTVPLPQVKGLPTGVDLLKAIAPSIISSLSNPTVISSSQVTFKNYVAFVYIIKDGNGNFHKETFFYVPSNNTVYDLEEGATSDAFPYYDKFVNSFQLLGQ